MKSTSVLLFCSDASCDPHEIYTQERYLWCMPDSSMCSLYVLSIVIPLGACASPTDIFKRQNAMTHNIALAGVEAERMGDQSRIELLTQAEEEIDNACGPLQEAGATRLLGGILSIPLRFRAWLSSFFCNWTVTNVKERFPSRR